MPPRAERKRRGSGPPEEPAPGRLSASQFGWRGLTPRWPRSLRLGSASGYNIGSLGLGAQGGFAGASCILRRKASSTDDRTRLPERAQTAQPALVHQRPLASFLIERRARGVRVGHLGGRQRLSGCSRWG